MQVINSTIKSLKIYGVSENDITVYDAIRPYPAHFYEARLYHGVHYVGNSGTAEAAVFSKNQPSLKVAISNPKVSSEVWLPDLLYNTTYLINMPILKRHQAISPVTLGFKNHFGSTNNPSGMHSYAQPGASNYSSSYSPFIDLYTNPHIGPKTVLTLADGLFGAPSVGAYPEKWQIFGNDAPNSLFFSRDPLAIECVMIDFLNAEWGVDSRINEWLQLAENAHLGTFERGDPWHPTYQRIRYSRIEI